MGNATIFWPGANIRIFALYHFTVHIVNFVASIKHYPSLSNYIFHGKLYGTKYTTYFFKSFSNAML